VKQIGRLFYYQNISYKIHQMYKFMPFLLLSVVFITSGTYAQQYGWKNIGNNLPNTVSTATISDIAMSGDTMWITSGYGTYLNQVPGEIYFSTDRGATFTIQSTLYGTHAIFMKDALNGWCGGVEGQIYQTTDGGATWVRRFSLSRTLLDIDFPPGADTGICTGFQGAIRYLSASGLQTINSMGYVSNISSVSCIDRRHAFIAGGEIIAPVIDGVLQIDQSYPGTDGIYAIDMLDTLTGWCVGSPTAAGSWDSAGCMIIRTDDGHNWVEQVNPVKGKHGTLMAVKVLNDQEVWIAGTSGVILHTTDGGQTWIREAEGLTNEMLYGIWVVNSQEVYVTGNNRTLLRYGLISGQEEPESSLPEITLFPNPANGVVHLRCDRQWLVRQIRVTDAAGRQVRFIEDPAEPSVDLSGLEEGIYLIHIQTADWTKALKVFKLD